MKLGLWILCASVGRYSKLRCWRLCNEELAWLLRVCGVLCCCFMCFSCQVTPSQSNADSRGCEKKRTKKNYALTWENWPGMTVGYTELWDGENKGSRRNERREDGDNECQLLPLLAPIFVCFFMSYIQANLWIISLPPPPCAFPPGAGRCQGELSKSLHPAQCYLTR